MGKKRVVLFGIGKDAETEYEALNSKYEIVGVFDNDTNRQGEDWNGYCILPPSHLKKIKWDLIYICSSKYYMDIRKQLMERYGAKESDFVEQEERKYTGELNYWRSRLRIERKLTNAHYKDLMLNIAGEKDDTFWKNKIVADFGCGPRGSLVWTKTPAVKIGIDVLVPRYMEEFSLNEHDMIYVTSSERVIPIPDSYVDYLCTINSLDHVTNLYTMIDELIRILKSGGELIASFNLNEASSLCEPHTLTEKIIMERFLINFDIKLYKKALKDSNDTYRHFRENDLIDGNDNSEESILWVRGVKKGE